MIQLVPLATIAETACIPYAYVEQAAGQRATIHPSAGTPCVYLSMLPGIAWEAALLYARAKHQEEANG